MNKQEKTNELARESQEKGIISQELFDNVKGICYAKMMRSPVTRDYYDAYTCEAIHEAFRYWNFEKGGYFSLYVHNMISKFIMHYDRKESRTVALPLYMHSYVTASGETIDEIRDRHIEIHPDTLTLEDGTEGVWDAIASSKDFSDTIGPTEVEVALEGLSEKMQKLYYYHYVLGYTGRTIAEMQGVSTNMANIRIRSLNDAIKQALKHQELACAV